MNTELIQKITGKEYYIVNRIANFTASDYGTIIADENIIYEDGKYNKFSIKYKGKVAVSKTLIKDNKNNIVITDIIGTFDNVELDIKNKLINLYKEYQFTICVCDRYIFEINAKLVELKDINATGDGKMINIQYMFDKIKSINLVDKTVFKNDKVILGDRSINILTNLDENKLNDSHLDVVYNGIERLYKDGMTEIYPTDLK